MPLAGPRARAESPVSGRFEPASELLIGSVATFSTGSQLLGSSCIKAAGPQVKAQVIQLCRPTNYSGETFRWTMQATDNDIGFWAGSREEASQLDAKPFTGFRATVILHRPGDVRWE